MIVLLLIVFTKTTMSSVISQQYSDSNDQNNSEQEYEQWRADLDDFLMHHQSKNIQIMSLYNYTIRTISRSERVDLTGFNNIRSLFNSRKLNSQSMALVIVLCSFDEFSKYCNMSRLLKRLIKSDKKNIDVYLIALAASSTETNEAKITKLIKKMSQSTFSDNFYGLDLQFESLLQTFVKNNPFPEGYAQAQRQRFTEVEYFSSAKIADIEKNIDDYLTYYLMASYTSLMPVTDFSGLIAICNDRIELDKSCLKIANTLINKSDLFSSAIAGHSIKTAVLKKEGESKKLTKALQKQAIYNGQFECLSNAMNSAGSLDYLFDLKLFKFRSSIEREFGQLEATIKILRFIHTEKIKKHGESVFIPNPEMCIR